MTDRRKWPALCRYGLAAAIVLVIGLPAPVGAQLLAVEGLSGRLGFGLNYEDDEIRRTGRGDLGLERLFFFERVALLARGSVYDPNLARVDLGFDFGLFQDEVTTRQSGSSTSRSGDGILTGYDARLGLLENLPYSVDLFGHRSENNIRRDLAGRTEIDVESFGATVRARDLPLVSTITAEQRDVEQRFTLLPGQVQQDERRRTVRYRGERRGETTMLDADYRFEDVLDRARRRGAFQIHAAGIRHKLQLGEFLDRSVGSSLRFFRREGLFATNSVFLNESASVRNSATLHSNYGYGFAFFDGPGGQRMNHNLLANLRHRFYESIDSALNLNLGYTDLSPGHSRTAGAVASSGYRKGIPLGAAIHFGGSVGYQLTDQSLPTGRLAVADESHQLPDGEPVFLANPNVITTTIVVTDAQQTTVFAEGADYFVEQIGRRTRFRRNEFGRIEAGETVLVSYDFASSADLRLGSRPLSFNGGLDFEWISIFYSGERLRQDVFRGDRTAVVGSTDTSSAGVEVRPPIPGATLLLRNEWVRYDAIDIRYSGFVFTQRASTMPHRMLTLSLTGNESFFDFRRPDRSRDYYVFRADATWYAWQSLLFNAFGEYRRLRETTVPHDRLVNYGVRERWTIGRFVITASYDHDVHDIGLTERTGELVRFEVTRWFGR